MLSPRILTAATVVFFGLFTAVALGAAAQKSSPPPNDACGLLSIEEIKSVLGSSTIVRKGRPLSGGTERGSHCAFGTANGSVIIALESITRQENEEFKKTLRDAGERLDPVSGLGDDAFFIGERINVLVGNKRFALYFGESRGESPQRKEKVLALAKLCVAKLR